MLLSWITDLFLQEDAITIDDLCDVMTNQSIGDELDRYAAVNAMFLYSDSLNVSYQDYLEFMKNTSWDSSAAEGGKYQNKFYLLYMHHCSTAVVLPDLYRVRLLSDF